MDPMAGQILTSTRLDHLHRHRNNLFNYILDHNSDSPYYVFGPGIHGVLTASNFRHQ
jgi:hypothetical protein